MKREEDRERLRANYALCEPQWCGSKCVFSFCLSLAHKHTKRSCSKSRCRDIFTNFILSIWPTGSFCLVHVSLCGSQIWFQPHDAGQDVLQAHRVHLTPSHRHSHISHTNCINSDVFQIQYVWWFMGSWVSHSFFNVSASASICLSLHLCISVSILLLLLSIHTSSLTALLSPPSSAWRDFCLLTAYLMFNALWFPPRHLQAWKERRGGRKFNNRVKRGDTEKDKGRPWL